MRLSKKICFLLVYLLLPIPFIGYWLGGAFSFLIFMLIFSIVPIVDYWIADSENPTPSEELELQNATYFKRIIEWYVPCQFLFIAAGIYLVTTQPVVLSEWLGLALSIGLITGGIGITLAHELMHKNSKKMQFLSKALLMMVCYGHFIIEHVRGHHLRVATPIDPASARLGESLYQFLPRTIIGSFKSAWHLEGKRLEQKNLSRWNWHNQFYWIIGAPVIITTLCATLGGISAALFFIMQSCVAILMLEMVNYIEHYGLQRRKLANGQYEKVSIHHSWNANHWLSNLILFHLQRHSDHHTIGSRPYQILRHMDESPQLPSGYIGMMMLSLIPSLWRKVMDKRVLQYQTATTVATEDKGFAKPAFISAKEPQLETNGSTAAG